MNWRDETEAREPGSRCVAETMSTALVTITPDTFVESARRLAANHEAEYLLVLENGSLAGIVGVADLRRPSQTRLISECMSTPVLCVGPDTTLLEAATIMDERSIGCLPVVADSFLVGIVTEAELRSAGLASDGVGDLACAACRIARAARRHPVAGGAALCSECLETFFAAGQASAN